jgi:hypothetical protein
MIPTEHEEQVKFIDWWNWNAFRWPDVVLFATPNGGHRHKAVAAKLKAEGVLAGVPDIVCHTASGTLWIEMKRTKGGVVSPAQKSMIARLEKIGHTVKVCRGACQAIEAIEEYMEDNQ